MKIMDTLIKRVEAAGLKIKLVPKHSDARSHCLTFVSDGRERIQVSVIEKRRGPKALRGVETIGERIGTPTRLLGSSAWSWMQIFTERKPGPTKEDA